MSEESTFSRTILILAAAIVIPVVAVAAYVFFARVPTPYSGQILSVNVYPIHQDLSQPSTVQGVGGQNETYDQVLILADIRIQAISKVPLFLRDMWANVNLPTETDRATAVSASDFDKVFIAYPELRQFQKPPLKRDMTLQPGQQAEGMVIFSYQMNKATWDARTGTDISLDFIHQKPLVLHIAK